MEEQSQPPTNAPEKTSLLDTLKSRQFLVGFFGWYIVNGAVWFVLPKLAEATENLWAINMFLFFLLALIILPLFKRTRKFGLGVLAAVAVNFILSILSGAFINAVCFLPFYFR